MRNTCAKFQYLPPDSAIKGDHLTPVLLPKERQEAFI